MAISEKIELLGKEYYAAQKIGIPGELTLQAIPTVSELDFVTSEDFDQVMIDKILPQAVKEQIDFKNLLDIDYSLITDRIILQIVSSALNVVDSMENTTLIFR